MHPIVALWSHPRSMSTAIERIMLERRDMTCLHEPFMYDYYIEREERHMPHFMPDEDQPTAYEDIRDTILKLAETRPVFLKDMSYYILPYLESDRAFFERIQSAFLIRDPRAAILSYRKLDPDLSSEEVGIAAQWAHFQWLESRGIDACVLSSETARTDPQGVIGAFWAATGLPHKQKAFTFTTATANPELWQSVSGWHEDAIHSQGIRPLSPDELNKKHAEFDAVALKEPRLNELLQDHLYAYDALLERAIMPISNQRQ